MCSTYLNKKYEGESRLVHSSITRFMEDMSRQVKMEELPVADGELRFGYRWAFNVTGGVYSSRMYIKQANTRSQWLLERYLEPMNVLVTLKGGRSQSDLIRQGWTYLMKNHPHDSICGCSIDPVHREMMTRFEKLDELGKGIQYFAWMDLLPDKEGDGGDDRYIAFFNPSPFTRNEIVECEIEFFKQKVVVGLNPDVVVDPPLPDVKGFELLDADGNSVPFEVINETEDFGISYNRFDYPSQTKVDKFTIRVALNDLPPMGLRKLKIVKTKSFEVYKPSTQFYSEDSFIENEFLRVDVREDGTFYVRDQKTGLEYGPIGHFEDGADAGDEYNYSPPEQDFILKSNETAVVSTSLQDGTLKKGLQVKGEWKLPLSLNDDETARTHERESFDFTTTAWLTPESRYVQFETKVNNRVKDHRFRVLFETGCQTNIHYADSQFGILKREQKHYNTDDFSIEVPASVAPMQRLVNVEDTVKGATLIAVGLPEYELKYNSEGTLALTLLRCVSELGKGAIKMRPGGRGGWKNSTPDAQCPGEHTFTYAFMPHSPGWAGQMEEINRAAEQVHLPVKKHRLKIDEIDQDDEWTLKINPESLVLSAFKEANDGQGYILRVYNPTNKIIDGSIAFSNILAEVTRTNMEEVGREIIDNDDISFRDQWQPYKVLTYRIKFK